MIWYAFYLLQFILGEMLARHRPMRYFSLEEATVVPARMSGKSSPSSGNMGKFASKGAFGGLILSAVGWT